MKKTNTSLLDDQEALFIVPGKKGTNWKATKGNFFHLAKVAYYFTVSQCEKYIINDDMRDPDATIDESLRENMDPIVDLLKYYEANGMPFSIGNEIRNGDWLKMAKKDVIKDLSAEAKEMRKRKNHLRKQRDERKLNHL